MSLRQSAYTLSRPQKLYVVCAAIFITALVVAEATAAKLFTVFELPFSINILGQLFNSVIMTAGVIAFPVTFIITDLLNEYYGTLIDNGVRGYSRDEFEWDARLSVIPRFVMRVGAFSLFPQKALATPEGIARISPFMKKLQILVDWNCEEVIPN